MTSGACLRGVRAAELQRTQELGLYLRTWGHRLRHQAPSPSSGGSGALAAQEWWERRCCLWGSFQAKPLRASSHKSEFRAACTMCAVIQPVLVSVLEKRD